MRAPIPFMVGADARPASTAALRVHANARLQREPRLDVCPAVGASADAVLVSALCSVVMRELYKVTRANTNFLRQIAFIGQQNVQNAIGRYKQKGPDHPGLC